MSPNNTSPLLIVGMHRSGTSLVARLLQLCGLSLGPEKRLMPPGEGNPTGFWQNLDMDAITEELLANRSGNWDFLLPPLPPGWEQAPDLDSLRQRAREQISLQSRKPPWGWKDPRASLTIPFWKAALPGLKVLVVVRHPAEAARSLEIRTASSPAMAHHLWSEYNRRILGDTDPGERLITHYDSYFLDPGAELERVTQWLGLQPDDAQVAAALDSVSADTRQQRSALAGAAPDERGDAVPFATAELYAELCAAAGPVIHEAIKGGRLPMPDTVPNPVTLPGEPVSAEQQTLAGEVFDAGQRALEQDDTNRAVIKLQEAVTLNPRLADAQNDLGVLLLQAGEAVVAEAYLRVAVELQPGNGAFMGNLASAYITLGRTEDAIKAYLAYLQQAPDDLAALGWLAAVAGDIGNVDEAVHYAERVIAIDGQHADALALLAKFKSTG